MRNTSGKQAGVPVNSGLDCLNRRQAGVPVNFLSCNEVHRVTKSNPRWKFNRSFLHYETVYVYLGNRHRSKQWETAPDHTVNTKRTGIRNH